MTTMDLPPAVHAFDGVAQQFDERFGAWLSVAAQRRAVRQALLRVFAPGSHLLELGGGTGEDALFMAAHDRRVLLTDGSPAMVARAHRKVEAVGRAHEIETSAVLIEELPSFADARTSAGAPQFDGVYSNFAAFNCVADLAAAGQALARIVRPGGHVILVVFGVFSIGEMVIHLLRGDVRTAFRRMRRTAVPARISGLDFEVHYPSVAEIARAFGPEFRLSRKRGVGVFVPPSAAEPGISSFPEVVRAMAAADRVVATPLWFLGDHVLLELERVA